MQYTCEEHQGCVVVFESHGSVKCPICEEIKDLNDQIEIAKEE